MRKKIVTGILSSWLMLSPLALAADNTATPAETNQIQLHESPDINSKIVDTIIQGAPITLILSQGNWIKVADPKNGMVGWIQKDDLKEKDYPQIYLKTWNEKTGNKKPQGHPVIQSEQRMDKMMRETLNDFKNR